MNPLCGLIIPLESNPELFRNNTYNYSITDLHKACLLLEKGGIINDELRTILNVINSKYGIIQITNEDKQNFMNGLRKTA